LIKFDFVAGGPEIKLVILIELLSFPAVLLSPYLAFLLVIKTDRKYTRGKTVPPMKKFQYGDFIV